MSAMTYQRPSSPLLPARPRRLPRAAVAPRVASTAHVRRMPYDAAPTPYRAAGAVSTTAAPARLTRRGRVAVVLVLALIAMVAFSLGRASSAASSAGTPARPRPTTVVQPGDTLWSIARRLAPADDPRVMVERLADLNDLGGRPIQAGQRLTLPYAA